jgi:hypothetical protein
VTLQTAARKRVRLGKARFRIAGRQTRTVTVRVSKPGRALIRRKGRLRVRVLVTGIDKTGNKRRIARRMTVRAAAARRP